jgi:hypothetical protein
MSKYLLFLFTAVFSIHVSAQREPVIPLIRKVFHDNIDKTQKEIDLLDKKQDKSFNADSDQEVNLQVSYTLHNKVDDIQNNIEWDKTLNPNEKVRFLRGLNEVLSSFEAAYRLRQLKADQLPLLVNAFGDAMNLELKKGAITPVIRNLEPETGGMLLKAFTFQKNVGLAESKEVVLLKTCQKYPDRILSILKANPNVSFADSLLKVVAQTQQENIYSYAQSNNTPLGRRIQKIDDPLVKTISRLANIKEGRMFFPFLDNLYKGKITMEQISSDNANVYKYYSLLVNTQIEYTARLRNRDTPMAMNALTAMLKQKAVEEFINEINGLHEQPDNIRMKKVEPLNPQELYYLCVLGEDEIYTSSYLKVYERIFQRMKNPNSDTLLMSVNFDHFKKFIKMSANYNTLDDFLKRMEKDNAEILMRAFAGGLERTNSLEDAVDVADSYASISDKNLRNLILNEVESNVDKQTKNDNKRGLAIYDLLNSIFSSLDSSSKIDISAKYGIPPIYSMKNNSLKDSSGKIIIQQFFYGDKDGLTVFNTFKAAYNNAAWKTVNKKDWIEVSSKKGVPITIYANKPLDEKEGLDEKAQQSLDQYLEENNLSPTVVIHRGHSYHVSSTIEQLVPTSKVVLLGSCGGYQNINRVLNICPYAHIIASKQVGSGTVNGPMIISITETLRQGKDLNWPYMWKNLGRQLKSNNLFEDYVPPYKNLGALFIMAYNKVMEG